MPCLNGLHVERRRAADPDGFRVSHAGRNRCSSVGNSHFNADAHTNPHDYRDAFRHHQRHADSDPHQHNHRQPYRYDDGIRHTNRDLPSNRYLYSHPH